MDTRTKALLVVPLAIAALCALFAALGCLLVFALGLPIRFGMPTALRAVGLAVLTLGFLVLGWLSRYRKPFDVIQPTYLSPATASQGRSESQP